MHCNVDSISAASYPLRRAWRRIGNCCATTDKTSMSIQLNSSRQVHADCCGVPEQFPCHVVVDLVAGRTCPDAKRFGKVLNFSSFCTGRGSCTSSIRGPGDRHQHLSVSGVMTSLLQHPCTHSCNLELTGEQPCHLYPPPSMFAAAAAARNHRWK